MLLVATTDAASGFSWVELCDALTGASRRLVEGSFPVPAPDGEHVALIVDTLGSKQLAIFTMTSGRLRLVTTIPGGVGEWWEQNITFAWSPNARTLAYALRSRPPAWAGDSVVKAGETTAEVIGGPGDVPASSELFLYDLATDSTRKVLTRGGARIGDLSWFPDGRRLVFTANHAAHEYHDGILEGEVHTIEVNTGKELAIAAPGGLQQTLAPLVSPDGRHVAFRYHADSKLYDFTTSVGIVPDTGGAIHRLTGPELTISSVIGWSADGERLYFLRPFSPYRQIYSVTQTGTLHQITGGAQDITGAVLSTDGRFMAWCQIDARGGKAIVIASGDGKTRRTLLDLAPAMHDLRTGAVEEIRWASRDGLELRGLLILPTSFRAGVRYPLVVDVHGGGEGSRIYFGGALLRTTALEWHLWANLGYAVLIPDYRHSGNYGWAPILAARDKGRHYDLDFDDIMSGVDYVIAHGIADSSRLAIIGASAGAYRVNWAITHSRRFRVAVSYEGWGDEYFLFGVVPGGNRILEWENRGLPWDVPQNYIRNSPAFYMKGVTTPTLFIAGGETVYGGAVPQYTTYFMHAALQRQGIDTRFVKYRMEGHIVRRRENQQHVVRQIVDWVESHMK